MEEERKRKGNDKKIIRDKAKFIYLFCSKHNLKEMSAFKKLKKTSIKAKLMLDETKDNLQLITFDTFRQ